METPLSFIIIFFFFVTLLTKQALAVDQASCRTTCGSLEVKYPFGTGLGCGSPRFGPYVTCAPAAGDQLLLTTHTGSYPITSISYTTSTVILAPPYMSTCSSMQASPNLGLDWASPFQLGSSTFLLLSCQPPTSSLTIKGSPVCDPSSSHLCASIYTCPAVVGLGLPLFPPTNSCCVYSPANFNGKDELDLRKLECTGYASVVSLEDYPTDPTRWQYGIALKYSSGPLDASYMDNKCSTCESSGGVCGYSPPDNSFLCLCSSGINTTADCNGYFQYDQGLNWSSDSLQSRNKIWLGVLGGLIFLGAA